MLKKAVKLKSSPERNAQLLSSLAESFSNLGNPKLPAFAAFANVTSFLNKH